MTSRRVPHSCALENSRVRVEARRARADSTLAPRRRSPRRSASPLARRRRRRRRRRREVGFRPVARPSACAIPTGAWRPRPTARGSHLAGSGSNPGSDTFRRVGAPVAEEMAGVVPPVEAAGAPVTSVVAEADGDHEGRVARGTPRVLPRERRRRRRCHPRRRVLERGNGGGRARDEGARSRGGTRSPWICLSQL